MTRSKRVIGVTGITGSGTSTVAGILGELGGCVISADKLAHDATKVGQSAYVAIVGVFGESILLPSGEINRKALGAMVFGEQNADKLKWLESVIHPEVLSKTRQMVDDCKKPFIVIDAPLLIESGLCNECDEVWVVSASNEVRISRIMERDNIDEYVAKQRLKSRQNDIDLQKRADVVITNNGDISSLRKQVILSRKKKYTFCGDLMLPDE